MTWAMWAGLEDGPDGAYYANPAVDRRYPAMYGHGDIRRVTVAENTGGPYWGWIDAGETVPEMIQPHRSMFEVQFAYGPQAEEKAGKGRVVRLHIEEEP